MVQSPSNTRMDILVWIAVEIWRKASTLPGLVKAPTSDVDCMPMTTTKQWRGNMNGINNNNVEWREIWSKKCWQKMHQCGHSLVKNVMVANPQIDKLGRCDETNHYKTHWQDGWQWDEQRPTGGVTISHNKLDYNTMNCGAQVAMRKRWAIIHVVINHHDKSNCNKQHHNKRNLGKHRPERLLDEQWW